MIFTCSDFERNLNLKRSEPGGGGEARSIVLVKTLCYKPESRGFDSRLGNPSSRTMVLGFTQPLIEMSTRNLPGGKALPARKTDSLTDIYEPIV
jgi:hypothetical protein